MAAQPELRFSAIQQKRAQAPGAKSPLPVPQISTSSALAKTESAPDEFTPSLSAPKGFTIPFDPFRVADAVLARWPLILGAGLVLAILIGWAARSKFETHFIAVAQFIKQAQGNSLRQSESGDPYQPHELSIPTLTALMKGATILEKTRSRMDGRVSEGEIRAGLTVVPERNTDIVKVGYTSDRDAVTAQAVLQAYADEVMAFTEEIQQQESAQMSEFLQHQLAKTDDDLMRLNDELLSFAKRENLVDADKQMDAYLGELGSFSLKYESARLEFETLDLKIQSIERELSKVSPVAAKLQQAREEMASLQLRYTDEHPTMIEARERVRALEAAVQEDAPRLDSPPKPGESSVAESLYLELVKLRSDKQVYGEQLKKLDAVRAQLNARLEQLPRKALEYGRILSRKTALETSRALLAGRQREAALHEENAASPYRVLSMARIQDVSIEKPTKKLAMVCAGGFAAGSGSLAFLFALMAALDQRLSTPSGLRRATGLEVFGALRSDLATSPDDAAHWAFQTWTKLQTRLQLSGKEGAWVCGLLTDDSTREGGCIPALLGMAASRRGLGVIVISRNSGGLDSTPLREALAQPETALRKLQERRGEPLHLHLDESWSWQSTERQAWNHAVGLWSLTRRAAILVELREPEQPDTLLAAEHIPNLLWICRSGLSTAAKVQATLATYRVTGCRMIGAILDGAKPFRMGMLNKTILVAAALLLLPQMLPAAGPLVLGPGDTVNISAAGYPEYTRSGVAIGPDGRITYLQAQAMQAAGLTLDELRTTLNTALARYYKNLIVVVTPGAFESRKVYVLGKVVKKGAINIDRPLSILEVVAEAGGLETGLFQQNTVELADLGRSFLMRGQQRMPVNMEALFLRGDMTQNLLVESGDYLYFPSASSNEIYVLGNVKMQGSQGLLSHTSVHSAIAQAGGFTPLAYTQKILVVRGSLEKPEGIVVDMNDLIHARTKGFRLEPKDIVYVSDKPWARAEELLSFALSAFLQGTVSTWAGANVGPLIKEAIIPGRE